MPLYSTFASNTTEVATRRLAGPEVSAWGRVFREGFLEEVVPKKSLGE